MEDDPDYSPFGMEIADIEISTICHRGCPFCYKSNTAEGKNMSFATFQKLFLSFPNTLTQIAFGIGDIDANPDLEKILTYTRFRRVIPNITINGFRMTPQKYYMLAHLCGAVAVSYYNPETCYNAVKQLGLVRSVDRNTTLKQINIHCLLTEETYDDCLKVIEDAVTDERLREHLNAIVFLWLKPKGARNQYHQISDLSKLQRLVELAREKRVRIGFDSCSAANYLQVVDGAGSEYVEPCESTLFSVYINVDGQAFPCSFSEGVGEYRGVDALAAEHFVRDVWNSAEFVQFRTAVLQNKDHRGCRMCPIYDLRCDTRPMDAR